MTENEDSIVPGRPAAPKSFLHLFIPKGYFFTTSLLVEINVVVFIIMVASGVNLFAPAAQALVPWGANVKSLVLGGEWWRLFTCMFLHSGFLHVVLNMAALLFIGV